MSDIFERKAGIWCSRLNQLMKKRGYTQKTFLKEYKSRYGGGTQANVSRWLRVGHVTQKNGTAKAIGFPSYENMLNIADFFGVTIGYLTGETDFETFEMEKACQCLGIDENTGKALKDIASGKRIRFGRHQLREIRATLRYLLMADSFPRFINGLREYAENIYRKNHPLASQCLDYQCAYDEQYGEVRLSEFELQKIYFELIKEVVLDAHLPEMTIPRHGEDGLI